MDKNVSELAVEFDMAVIDVKEKCFRNLGPDMLDLSAQEFEMVQALFKALDASMKLVRKQADTIHEMNEKLDKLLSRD